MSTRADAAAWFAGRAAVLATMHGKEQVIAPLLAEHLGLHVTVPTDFNTDRFGTFTRDVDRPADQLTTARLKAEAALDQTGAAIAIVSEGSFGPHPALPLLPCDREIVLLRDRDHDLELVGEVISTTTNFNHQAIASVTAALAFAQKIGFPEHGLVAMQNPDCRDGQHCIKGIRTEAELVAIVTDWLTLRPTVHLETDMRAMHNPTRMTAIAAATQALIQQATTLCPACGLPGFRIIEHKPGLPCALCHTPTTQRLAVVYACQKCQLQQTHFFPDQQEVADPGLCNFCNP